MERLKAIATKFWALILYRVTEEAKKEERAKWICAISVTTNKHIKDRIIFAYSKGTKKKNKKTK